jgi:hypothetical protein
MAIIPIKLMYYRSQIALESWADGYAAGLRAEEDAKGYAAGILTVLERSGFLVHQEWLRERLATCTDLKQFRLWLREAPVANTLDELTDFMP